MPSSMPCLKLAVTTLFADFDQSLAQSEVVVDYALQVLKHDELARAMGVRDATGTNQVGLAIEVKVRHVCVEARDTSVVTLYGGQVHGSVGRVELHAHASGHDFLQPQKRQLVDK